MKNANIKKLLKIAIIASVGIVVAVCVYNIYFDFVCGDYNKIDPVRADSAYITTFLDKRGLEKWQFDENYELGMNKYGSLIFVNRDKAMSQIRKDCGNVIWRISTEFHIPPLGKATWHSYKLYDWQMSREGLDENEIRDFAAFMAIYPNSFPDLWGEPGV